MGAVAVRPFHVDQAVPSTTRLSADERRRAARIAHPAARARFVSGRLALRDLAADVLGLQPDSVAIEGPDHGPPRLAGHPDVGVSIAATRGTGVVAIALAARVGVDIEAADRRALPPTTRWCTPAEQAALAAVPSASTRRELALRLWSAKEARYKAGTELAPSGIAEPGSAGALEVSWLPLVPGYVVALAVAE